MKTTHGFLVACALLAHSRPLAAAEAGEFEAKARDYLQQQKFAPIEVKPGTRFQKDLDEQWLKWAERAIIAPFAKRAERWPKHEKEAVDFVRQALRFRQTRTHPDAAVTPASLFNRGEALEKAKVDDALVMTLTGWMDFLAYPGFPPRLGRFDKASKHPSLKELPPTVRLMILNDLYEIQSDSNFVYSRDAERVDAALACVEDPATFGPDDDEVMARMLIFLFYDRSFHPYEEKVKAVCEAPHLPEWVYTYFQGRLAYSKALKVRSETSVSDPNSPGFAEFKTSVAKAREFFTKAWKMRPDRSDPASTMIYLTNSFGPVEGEDQRVWFDRSVAAQFDNMQTYRAFMFACRDKGESMLKAFGLACALTRRHDTGVPEYLFEIMRRLALAQGNTRAVYKDPLFSQAVAMVGEGQVANPARAWERERVVADHAIRLWGSGDFSHASEALATLKESFSSPSRKLAGTFDARESVIRGECAISAAGQYPAWTAAEAAFLGKDLDKAGAAYSQIAKAFPNDVPHLLAGRIATVNTEKAIAAGQWVHMNVTPSLEDWTIHKGTWEGTADGVLINHGEGESAFILYNPRIGPNVEIRGEYEVQAPSNKGQGLGVVVGYGRAGTTAENFLLCLQLRFKSYCEAAILKGFHRTDEPFTNIGEPVPKWTFHVRYENGLIDYTVNDKVILKGHQPLQRGSPVGLEMKDGRVGFAHYTFTDKNITRVLKAEVRRLP